MSGSLPAKWDYQHWLTHSDRKCRVSARYCHAYYLNKIFVLNLSYRNKGMKSVREACDLIIWEIA